MWGICFAFDSLCVAPLFLQLQARCGLLVDIFVICILPPFVLALQSLSGGSVAQVPMVSSFRLSKYGRAWSR